MMDIKDVGELRTTHDAAYDEAAIYIVAGVVGPENYLKMPIEQTKVLRDVAAGLLHAKHIDLTQGHSAIVKSTEGIDVSKEVAAHVVANQKISPVIKQRVAAQYGIEMKLNSQQVQDNAPLTRDVNVDPKSIDRMLAEGAAASVSIGGL